MKRKGVEEDVLFRSEVNIEDETRQTTAVTICSLPQSMFY
jgi:hypothetical protein